MADKTNAQRLSDLQAALKLAKPKDRISLGDLAALWGVTKPRFVNKRAEIAGFPDPIAIEGNANFYSTRDTIKAMIAFLERHQRQALDRQKRQARLLGNGVDAEALAQHTPAELATINRLATDLDVRERTQGLYMAVMDVQVVSGEIFSEISEFMSNLSNLIDPHGKLAAEIRKTIDIKAHEALLKLYSKMKALLSEDAIHPGTRAPDRSPRKARPRRKRT